MLGKSKGEKRFFDRKKYGADVLFSHKSKTFSGKIKDISLSGAFIATPHAAQFSKNDTIAIDIPFTNKNSHVSRRARIIRVTSEGFAVKFL